MVDKFIFSAVFQVEKINVLRNVHIAENVDLLRNIADTGMHRVKGALQVYFFALNINRSFVGTGRINTIEAFQYC